MKKPKLVLPDEKATELPVLSNIKLNLNGKKPKGRNLYRKQLNHIRRLLK